MESSFPIAFLMGPYIISKVPSVSLISQSCTFGGNGMYRDYIAPAIYRNSWAPLPSPGLEEHPSGESRNLLK